MNTPGAREQSEASAVAPPPAIPDMELLRRIGQGGFGEVYLARNQTTGGLRAVKVVRLRGTTAVDPAGREIVSLSRLEQTARVRDPHLVTIHHVGKTADHLFYIMDLADDVSGAPAAHAEEYTPATLASRLTTGPASSDDCLRWSAQLLSALACLHREGLVHRDVKPANCLFIGGELKLADFGLLAQVDRSISRVGTLQYMPPDGIMDTRADVYAAGLVIYEMLTGLPSHRFPAIRARSKAILADRRLTALNRLMLKACQSDRRARFADAAEMLDVFRRVGVERLPTDLPGKDRTAADGGWRVFRHTAAVVCLTAGLVGGWAAWRSVTPPHVDVNFVTDHWDAEIWLDGRRLCQSDGEPWRTPCTVSGLMPKSHVVVLKRQGLEDLELGQIDFRQTREVIAHWKLGTKVPGSSP